MFSRYWLEAQEIDLNHPVTVQAMNGFSPEEIEGDYIGDSLKEQQS